MSIGVEELYLKNEELSKESDKIVYFSPHCHIEMTTFDFDSIPKINFSVLLSCLNSPLT